VFRICDILRRILILGAIHWIKDQDPDPGEPLFVSGSYEAKKKVFSTFFCVLLTVGTVHNHQSLKKTSHTVILIEKTQTVEIKVFLNFFLLVDKDAVPEPDLDPDP
jgi:hypothetical protein